MTIAAVILAAGASQRMGCPKQLLPIGGKPMLLRVVETVLACKLDQVIIVLGAFADDIEPLLAGKPVTVAINANWAEGIASSVRAGLACVSPGTEAVLFVPADLPRLTTTTIHTIVECFTARGASIVIPTCGGRRGNPVLFARPLFGELLALRGDRGGRTLFGKHAADIELVETDDDGILLDVDTITDYGQARESTSLRDS